jgi:hypothetical protein
MTPVLMLTGIHHFQEITWTIQVQRMSQHPLRQTPPRGRFAATAERLFRRKNYG